MRLLLADDHPVVRSGLRAILSAEKDVEIVGERSDGQSALDAIRELKPDVALLDIQMPRLSGLEVARALRAESSSTAVVVLTLHKEANDLQAALDAGVTGYVVKDDDATDLLEAVRAAARGQMHVSPRLTGLLLRGRQGEETRPAAGALTRRERDVLRLLTEGLRSKEIATQLKLSTNTVESYRRSLMDKLKIRSVAGLVKYALRHHLTDLEE